jgi:hypothetical protein
LAFQFLPEGFVPQPLVNSGLVASLFHRWGCPQVWNESPLSISEVSVFAHFVGFRWAFVACGTAMFACRISVWACGFLGHMGTTIDFISTSALPLRTSAMKSIRGLFRVRRLAAFFVSNELDKWKQAQDIATNSAI